MFKCVCMLSVNIRYHEVHRTADGNQVGYLPAPAHGVHGMHQRQTRAPVVQTVRRLVPPADEEHAELAAAGLDGSREHALGQFENGLRLHLNSPSGTLSINCSMIRQDSMISSMRTI